MGDLSGRSFYKGETFDYVEKGKPTGDSLTVRSIGLRGDVVVTIFVDEAVSEATTIPYERLHLMVVHGLLVRRLS